MIVINVYKDFLVDSKFSNYLEEVKTKIPRKKTKGCPVIYYWGEFCCFCS